MPDPLAGKSLLTTPMVLVGRMTPKGFIVDQTYIGTDKLHIKWLYKARWVAIGFLLGMALAYLLVWLHCYVA